VGQESTQKQKIFPSENEGAIFPLDGMGCFIDLNSKLDKKRLKKSYYLLSLMQRDWISINH
jgi:hypothetical protein